MRFSVGHCRVYPTFDNLQFCWEPGVQSGFSESSVSALHTIFQSSMIPTWDLYELNPHKFRTVYPASWIRNH